MIISAKKIKHSLKKITWINLSLLLDFALLIATVVIDSQYIAPGIYLRDGQYVLTKYKENFLFNENSYVDKCESRPDEDNILYDTYRNYCFHNVKVSDGYHYRFADDVHKPGERIIETFRNDETQDEFRFVLLSDDFGISFHIEIDGNKLKFKRQTKS